MKDRLTQKEQELLGSFERDEWVPVKDLPKRKRELARYARNTLIKDKRLNIRISERDLNDEFVKSPTTCHCEERRDEAIP